MKANISTYPTALRLLAALFLFLLFTLPAAGEEGSAKKWDGSVATALNFGGGAGVKGDPVKISTPEELAYFAKQVNAGGSLSGKDESGQSFELSNNGFSGYYFELSDNIDLAGRDWKPIGTYSNEFRGHFDGQGHVVKGLKVDINGSDEIYGGLFGCVYDGTIQNLGVELSEDGIKAGSSNSTVYAGGIVGQITGSDGAATIRNCYVTGSGGVKITEYNTGGGSASAGGIAGCVNKAGGGGGNQSVTLTHCYATVDVEGNINYTGGIVGQLSGGTLSFTYATGEVTGGSGFFAGGICGYSSGGSLINNLALNKEISSSSSGRVLGKNYNSSTTLGSNYANPDMLVNDNLVTDDTENPATTTSGASTHSNKLQNDLITANNGAAWSTDWEWKNGQLPQLKMVEEGDTPPLSYNNWPSNNQPTWSINNYLTLAPWADCAAKSIADGSTGTKGDPILIATPQELAYLAQQVNNNEKLIVGKNTTEIKNENGFSGKYFALSAKIDLEGGEWTPIGNASNRYFGGHFDGMGYTVKGLKIDMDVPGAVNGWTLAGLFGYVENGTLQNLGVELADAGIAVSANQGNVYAGGIAGKIAASSGNTVILRNCYVTGKGGVRITGAGEDACAGGITGNATAIGDGIVWITHCYSLVDVEATGTGYSYAGGIAGDVVGELSYTYATGKVEVKGGTTLIAGGICGSSLDNLSNNLALNGEIMGSGYFIHRVRGEGGDSGSNYASTQTKVNGSPVHSNNPSFRDGANTWLNTFEDDLKKEPAGNANGWNTAWTWTKGKLPQLLMITGEDDNGNLTYDTWSPGTQPSIDASDYLTKKVTLHIVRPVEGGYLGVFAPAVRQYLFDGDAVTPGITLLLEAAAADNYRFDGIYSGTTADAITNKVSGTTIPMPTTDLWLKAIFTCVVPPLDPEPEPEPDPTPVYYTVTLPEVEGATTDPVAGSYEVEAWSTFRFYLTTDTAYSESQPVVTTDRGETLTPRSSDGAYLVKYVRSDVEVFIDGLFPNNPVANESITDPHAAADSALPRIWTEPSVLCFLFPDGFSATPVRILSPDGRLLDAFQAAPGLSRRQQLPTGIYIVWIGDTVRKVVVRN
ncbi:hypothetical protein [Parabacteroides sp.]